MFINTSRGFCLTLALLFIGFIWTSFQPQAPYVTFAGTVGLAFGALAGKRLAQKAGWAQSEENENEEIR